MGGAETRGAAVTKVAAGSGHGLAAVAAKVSRTAPAAVRDDLQVGAVLVVDCVVEEIKRCGQKVLKSEQGAGHIAQADRHVVKPDRSGLE